MIPSPFSIQRGGEAEVDAEAAIGAQCVTEWRWLQVLGVAGRQKEREGFE